MLHRWSNKYSLLSCTINDDSCDFLLFHTCNWCIIQPTGELGTVWVCNFTDITVRCNFQTLALASASNLSINLVLYISFSFRSVVGCDQSKPTQASLV